MIVGGQFNRVKTFPHVLTNNNGDSLALIGEADSALHTANYYDGWYRVFIKAMDLVGNSSLDITPRVSPRTS